MEVDIWVRKREESGKMGGRGEALSKYLGCSGLEKGPGNPLDCISLYVLVRPHWRMTTPFFSVGSQITLCCPGKIDCIAVLDRPETYINHTFLKGCNGQKANLN